MDEPPETRGRTALTAFAVDAAIVHIEASGRNNGDEVSGASGPDTPGIDMEAMKAEAGMAVATPAS